MWYVKLSDDNQRGVHLNCFNKGAVDQEGYEAVMASARLTQDALDAGEYELATSLWGTTEYVILNVAHNIDFYNILKEIPSRGTQKHIRIKVDTTLNEWFNGAT